VQRKRGPNAVTPATAAATAEARAEALRHKQALANAKKESKQLGRGFAEIGKVARMGEARRHREALRHIKQEQAAKVAAERAAATAAVAAQRAAAQRVASARRAAERFSKGVVGSVGSTARNVVGVGSGILAIGGGLAVGSAVKNRMDVSSSAVGIANRAAAVQGETRSRGEIHREVMSQTEAIEKDSGRGQAGILDALSKFLEKTGDLGAGQALLPQIASLADAMGMAESETTELAQAAGIAYAGLRATGVSAEDASKQTEDLMRAFAGQSAVGQISMGDLASVAPTLLAAGSRISGDQAKNIAQMTALANISVATASASPAEAATAVQRLTGDLLKGSGKLKKMGVDVFDSETGGIRDLSQLLPEIIAKTGGKPEALLKAGFGERGIRAIEPLANLYKEKGGGQAGIDAIGKEIAKYTGSVLDEKQVTEGAKFTRGGDSRQIAMAFQDLERTIAKDFIPVLMKDLIPAFVQLAPHIKTASEAVADFVSYFAKNPLKGIGMLIGAAIAKDIALAGVGKLAVGALATVAGKASGGAGRLGVKTGLGASSGGSWSGAGKAAGIGGAVGFTIASAILTAGIVSFEGGEAAMKESGSSLQDIRKMNAPEDAAAARELVNKQRDIVDKTKDGGIISSLLGRGFAEFIGTESKTELKTQEAFLAEMEAKLQKLEALDAVAQKMSEAGDKMMDGANKIASAPSGGGANRTDPIIRR
jgi:hypothetical protein